MQYLKFFSLIIFVCLSLLTVNALAGDNVPVWANQAAVAKAPAFDKGIPAVVLHSEQNVNVGGDGMLTITTNYAVRLLKREGKEYAVASSTYLKSASKVKDLKAWLIRSNGTVKSYGKEQVVDVISNPNDVYDEYRIKIIRGSDDADVGDVFAYQTVVEERPLFTQDKWEFQDNLPTLLSRYTLNLPNGWQAESITFNRPEIKPQVSGSNYTWEVRDLPPITIESDSPKFHALAPRINVNYSPSGATANVYKSWQDVSRWYTDLSEPSLTVDDTVAGKARELTANAKTELEKIRAIANFVQNLQYISIDIGISRGGGHRPRPANVVLQRGYGDCKDKANLMRAMLKALKIESYLVLIWSGDPTYVRQEWASPREFNHCIIAVKVSNETIAPTVITHEKLGRLLIFDATDESTLLGDFPDHEQGGYALVAAGAEGALMQMPILPPDVSRLERQAEAQLLPDGSLRGTISEKAFGQTASSFRRESKALSAGDYKTMMERWLTYRIAGAQMSKLTPADRSVEGRFDIDIEFTAKSYAQLMQGRLMIFKPAFVGRLDSLTVSEKKRMHPVLLDGSSYAETIKVKLPEGFVVDEMPEPSKLETVFGKYTVTYEVKDGYLLFNRSLVLNKSTIAADKYDSVKNFFAQVRAAEQNPVVLLKK